MTLPGECYEENPIGGVGTALIVGGIALVGYLLFSKKSAAKPATAPATCPIDFQKLDRWGQARGFPVVYFPRETEPLTSEEFFSRPEAPSLPSGEQAVAVLGDGSFWYFLQSEISPGVPLTGRADNLRTDYCSFPDQPPPQVPPGGGTVSGTLGQSYVVSELYPETSWKKGARQFWFWHSPLRQWQLIKEIIYDPYFPGALATSTHLDYDLEEFAHVDYGRYAPYWVAEVWWIFADGAWHVLDDIVESPQVDYSGM